MIFKGYSLGNLYNEKYIEKLLFEFVSLHFLKNKDICIYKTFNVQNITEVRANVFFLLVESHYCCTVYFY